MEKRQDDQAIETIANAAGDAGNEMFRRTLNLALLREADYRHAILQGREPILQYGYN